MQTEYTNTIKELALESARAVEGTGRLYLLPVVWRVGEHGAHVEHELVVLVCCVERVRSRRIRCKINYKNKSGHCRLAIQHLESHYHKRPSNWKEQTAQLQRSSVSVAALLPSHQAVSPTFQPMATAWVFFICSHTCFRLNTWFPLSCLLHSCLPRADDPDGRDASATSGTGDEKRRRYGLAQVWV